ncbi:hypothetical protein EV356DRAFT_81105 [Viridothelium virens]|uniref:Uncharacterized protein n=1 Tax=Viridothelium virens TaxID=1048519 RepID=A0A6A6GS33_VIRVR|nr:hypothetical protein EV356DRAFT_81105 [Viridothelium virens]
MEIWKPHGRQPQSPSGSGIWARQPEDKRNLAWESIVCFQKPLTDSAFVRNLGRLFNSTDDGPPSAANDRITDLTGDWVFILKCLYATGINDAISSVRMSQKVMDHMKYEQMINPSSGKPYFYLLNMQHFEYWKQLVKDLYCHVSDYPPLRIITYPEGWTKMVKDECRRLENEINTTYGEASRIRKLR